jgi:hypothetical protein
LRFALFTMAVVALLQRAGISSNSGGLGSYKTSLACVRVCVVFLELVAFGVSVLGLGSMFFDVFLNLVMRLSCLMSDFVMGGVVLCLHLLRVVGSWARSFGLGGGSSL